MRGEDGAGGGVFGVRAGHGEEWQSKCKCRWVREGDGWMDGWMGQLSEFEVERRLENCLARVR